MRKIILGTAALFSLLFLISYGWLYYRKHQSFLVPVHKDADLIVRMNVDGILKTLALDFLTTPRNYSKADKKKKSKEKLETGLEVPANVLLYNLKNQPRTTFFGYLKISDATAFRKFLKQQLKADTFEVVQNGITSAYIDKYRINILFNDQAVVFAFSVGKPSSKINATMQDILQLKNILSPSDNILSSLKNLDGQISFFNQACEGSVNFEDGEIRLLSTISADGLNIPDKTLHRSSHKESSVVGWLDADLRPLFNENNIQIKDQFDINLDSIVEYTGQHIEFEILKTVKQADSVVTYSYDDNFEKIEVITVEEKVVPEVHFTFENTSLLLPYLRRQNIVDEKLKVNKEVFPLFDLYASEKGDYLELSSNKLNYHLIKHKETEQFLYLSIDFNRIREQNIFSFTDGTAALDSLIISGEKAETKTCEIKATIYLENKNSNALHALIDF